MKKENKRLLKLIDEIVEGQIGTESEIKDKINKHNNYIKNLELNRIRMMLKTFKKSPVKDEYDKGYKAALEYCLHYHVI